MSALVLTACSAGPLEVTGTAPTDDATAEACEALVGSLPDKVGGQSAIERANGDGWAKAWGDPAVVLRCGVAAPGEQPAETTCLDVSGIGWVATQDGEPADLDTPAASNETVDFTTITRSIPIQVSVPAKRAPASDALAELSEPILKATRRTASCS
jgi:hypothetical protein